VAASWSEAYEEILAAFADKGERAAGLTGPRVSNEGLFLFKRLFSEAFRSDNLDHRWRQWLMSTGPAPRPIPIASLEERRHILVFGTHLAEDLPIVHLRVRKAWSLRGATVDVAYSAANEVERFADTSLRCRPGTEAALAKCLLGEALKPGKAAVSDAVRAEFAGFNADTAEEHTGVSGESVRSAAARLGEGAVVLSSDRLFDAPEAPTAWETLRTLASATGSEFVCYPTGTNAAGAELLGLVPTQGLTTWQILEGCRDGRIEALWLAEADPAATHQEALENVPFLVYQGTLENEAMAYASVVLPMAAPGEQDGTWTNCEGRVQRFRQAISPPGEAKPAWRIFAECLLRAQPSTPFFNPGEVMEEIVRAHPGFAPALYSELPEEGALVARESLVGEPAGGGG
jgi:predicted molibdopterin-dependent oxidoreductase YjgC